MSERVMRGPLIEFGTSFWDSDDASTEFSGLSALNLDQTGKYGIGFFSVLMISSHITITSRRYDRGHDDARTMTFRDGLKLRPLISNTGGSSLGSLSTRVQLEITPSHKEKLLSVWLPPGNEVPINLKTIVAHLCCCLDCNVYIASEHEEPVLAHSRSWSSDDPTPWLRDCTFADAWANETMDLYLKKASALTKPILAPNGEPIGRAAIGFGFIMTGIGAIGRLVSGQHTQSTQSFSESYIGALGFEPQGPSRLSQTELVCPKQVAAWASEQAKLAAEMDFNDQERYLIAWNTALYGGDPFPPAMAWLNRSFLSVTDLRARLESGSCVVFVLEEKTSGSPHRLGQILHAEHPSFQIGFSKDEIEFRVDCVEGFRASHHGYSSYHLVGDSEVFADHSLIGCLRRSVETIERNLITEFVDAYPVAKYIGENSPRNRLKNGMILNMPVLRVSLS